jgi:hypothetical protein
MLMPAFQPDVISEFSGAPLSTLSLPDRSCFSVPAIAKSRQWDFQI